LPRFLAGHQLLVADAAHASFDAVEFALEHPDWREQLVRAGCRPALYPAIVKEIEAGISRMRGPLAKESKPD
jgi:hypothetical protein